ncbi:MAG: methylenetetrahydrofolate reductase [Roseibium sp.]
MLGRVDTFREAGADGSRSVCDIVAGYSIEVLPRTAAKIDDFRSLLPTGTRVYIANVEGTDFDDMIRTARRLRGDGFDVMPHLPARLIRNKAEFETMLARYRDEANVSEALLIGGGVARPAGDYDNTMQLLETGLFDSYGFRRLHIAGHPEGNPDIDRDGTSRRVDEALLWKQSFSERTDADMAIVTQFFFDAEPVLRWSDRLRDMGVTLPIHAGIAGPAKLQTLIKYAVACGVGPSVKVLKRRALDLSKLLLPYDPTDVLTDLARKLEDKAESPIAQVHFFPLGGIKSCVEWAAKQ